MDGIYPRMCYGVIDKYGLRCFFEYSNTRYYGTDDYTFKFISLAPLYLPNDSNNNAPPLDWQYWPQDKRNTAVGLLTSADWDVLFKALQQSGELQPGEQINVPNTGIYGPDGKLRVLPGPYTNSDKPFKDSDIYKQLNDKQKGAIDYLLGLKDPQGENKYYSDQFNQGHKNNNGCFTADLGGHYGGDLNHNRFADYVTNSYSDFLVIDEEGEIASYDGIVQLSSAAALNFPETIGGVTEEKYGYMWLQNLLPPLVNSLPTQTKNAYTSYRLQMGFQFAKELRVANNCGFNFFVFFNNATAAQQLAAQNDLPPDLSYNYLIFN